jgi:hypothetical protein
MKKLFCILPSVLLTIHLSLKADEGMWLLPLIQKLNIDTMHALGLELSAEDIYSINHSSLKDAIVIFDGGCTGEIVSDQGLLFTNHHCGYDAIQNHSTLDHNYLEEGFWAMKPEEELPNPGMVVTFLVGIEDVTETMLNSVNDSMTEEKRNEKISTLADSISRLAVKDTDYEASVESFFGGNSYYLFVYEVFRDVRLVGAPPSSIGKFGYDTDNWMWPRHTGDFSVFRVYSSPDGKPADYSQENIPLKPKYALPISLKGLKKDDFAMVIGYPGTTNRYMTSYEIKELFDITNTNRIKIRGLRQEILLKDMTADEKINIQYASKYSRSSNYWKYSIGQNQGLKKLNVMAEKETVEKNFSKWISEDITRTQKYGKALELIKNAVEGRAGYTHALQYANECFFSATEIIAFANKSVSLYVALLREPENKVLVDSLAYNLLSEWRTFYNEYSPGTDRKIIPAILKLYRENVPDPFIPDFYNLISSKFKGSYEKYTEYLFAKSIFTNEDKLVAFLKSPSAEKLEKDPVFETSLSALDVYRRAYLGVAQFDDDFNRGNRQYVAGLMEMNKCKVFYPDANSTMRLTYGTVQDYYPRDAVFYDYRTTLKGVMEKEDPDNWEFLVPEKLKSLFAKKDFGPYGEDSIMPVCFLTTNDITGGNSGSPVIDAEGNLTGLAFDGNWEAMSGDIIFEPGLQRCICVDIRYVLFIMDKYAGALNLIREMKIVE